LIWKPAGEAILFSCPHLNHLWHSRTCEARGYKRGAPPFFWVSSFSFEVTSMGSSLQSKYHDHAKTLGSKYVKPDLAIAFNAGFSEEEHIHGALRSPIHVRFLNRYAIGV